MPGIELIVLGMKYHVSHPEVGALPRLLRGPKLMGFDEIVLEGFFWKMSILNCI